LEDAIQIITIAGSCPFWQLFIFLFKLFSTDANLPPYLYRSYAIWDIYGEFSEDLQLLLPLKVFNPGNRFMERYGVLRSVPSLGFSAIYALGHSQCMRQFADLKGAMSAGDPFLCLLQSIILPTH